MNGAPNRFSFPRFGFLSATSSAYTSVILIVLAVLAIALLGFTTKRFLDSANAGIFDGLDTVASAETAPGSSLGSGLQAIETGGIGRMTIGAGLAGNLAGMAPGAAGPGTLIDDGAGGMLVVPPLPPIDDDSDPGGGGDTPGLEDILDDIIGGNDIPDGSLDDVLGGPLGGVGDILSGSGAGGVLNGLPGDPLGGVLNSVPNTGGVLNGVPNPASVLNSGIPLDGTLNGTASLPSAGL